MTKHLSIAPRWIIFLIDIACICGVMFIGFLIRFNFNLVALSNNIDLGKAFVYLIAVNTTLMLILRTYSGIVRYTTIEDGKRILLLVFFSSVSLFIISELENNHSNFSLFPRGALAAYFFGANFSLIAYRVVIKTIFESLFVENKKKIKAIVYNAEREAILAMQMLSNNPNSNIKVIAFIEEDPKLIGKKIEGIPVLELTKHNLERLKKDGVELIIIAHHILSKDRLNFIVDNSLELDLKVQQVPPSEKWINNELDAGQLRNIKIEQLLDREVIDIKNEKLAQEIKGKKILVTGAAGSIGSEIVRQLLKYEPTIIILCDNSETPLHELMLSLDINAPVKSFIGDIKDRIRMEQIFEIYEPDIIYHAAAYKHVPLMEEHPTTAILNNVLGTKTLAELAVDYGVDKFVMISTDKAVNPTNAMGASKRIAEIFIQSYHKFLRNNSNIGSYSNSQPTKFITTRFGNVLGSNGSVIPRFQKQLEKGEPLTVTHPDITRYFMTIPEACQLVLEAGGMGKGGEIFVFDMGKPVRIADLAYKMIRLAGRMPNVNASIIFTGLRPGEKLYEELLNNSENSLPTYHNKILIAKVREYDFSWVQNEMDDLIRLAHKHIVIDTVKKMKDIVPEYISQNSQFSNLDK
ncbi:MAG TPA: nucleoside-diphosphate sugar epimerase/dehydratase [Edaphocola sp.]|nr:nucleoside-diphosphate sugar epimerase/dehydratase [Edaphocola sp.]